MRAVAGDPAKLQIMYGLAGERRLTELELAWLAGYERSQPVRIGNAAAEQFQLDVYGEVIDALYQARRVGLAANEWRVAAPAEGARLPRDRTGSEPDEGIWEVRGPRRHFTHSKVMAWVAFDRVREGGRAVRPPAAPSTAGAPSATRSTPRSAVAASTPRRTRSPSRTTLATSTRACS